MPIHEVNTSKQIVALAEQRSAVVLLWVDWAIHARRSAQTALEMVDRWNRAHVSAPLVLWKIDVSQQCGVIWDAVDTWLSSGGVSEKDSLMYGGAGALVWMRSGSIVGHLVNPNAKSVDQLLEMTKNLFGAQPER